MSDPYGQPAWGPQPGWQPQPAWGPQPQPPAQQQPTQPPPQPGWGTPQDSGHPGWATPNAGWNPPPRRSRTALWWSLGIALLAVLVAAGVTVFLLTRPVEPPTGVAAANADAGVTVTWEAAEDADRYEVHRGDDLLGTTAETTYVDAQAPGGTEVRYAVTALDDDGDRSDRVESDAVVTPLDALTEISASTTEDDVDLEWEAVTGADRYEVTRDGTLLADDLTGSPYRDEDVPLGDHDYELTAVDEDGDGSQTSIDVSAFSPGPWMDAHEIALAFPELVPAEPGGTSWQDSTCDEGTPTNGAAVVACAYPNGLRLTVLQFPDTAARDVEVGAARAFGGPATTWSYGDGPAEGDLVLSPAGPATWRYITFYDGELSSYVLRVDWDGHSQEELDAVWFAEAPF
ncbi:fibronectin type III domain-containing protein [Trujillonella endophytica]|uniref:Fibronectin type-III domain-containing protein n=1 Tax=Trujillonella endophytica TaxID=673521 RepID=A0A1H8U9N1_9ACTN|nr:hypothetical protein [Trujillella endophytica]SEO99747.1 hypothetical protein SAMN05660991_02695 [Trujillella endophytica]